VEHDTVRPDAQAGPGRLSARDGHPRLDQGLGADRDGVRVDAHIALDDDVLSNLDAVARDRHAVPDPHAIGEADLPALDAGPPDPDAIADPPAPRAPTEDAHPGSDARSDAAEQRRMQRSGG